MNTRKQAMIDLETELSYQPTLSQRLSRVILGTLLVPLFGDICILTYKAGGELVKEGLTDYLFFLVFFYIIAIIFTGIPTLIFRVVMEWSTQNLIIRLFYSFVFAVFLGVFISETLGKFFKTNTGESGMWILSSIIAVIITELLLYQHIKHCIKKHNQNLSGSLKPEPLGD